MVKLYEFVCGWLMWLFSDHFATNEFNCLVSCSTHHHRHRLLKSIAHCCHSSHLQFKKLVRVELIMHVVVGLIIRRVFVVIKIAGKWVVQVIAE